MSTTLAFLDLESLRQKAGAGSPEAQCELGDRYLKGTDEVGLDYSQALTWFLKAAVQGNPTAQNQLGIIYRDGLGTPQHYSEALVWFHKSADQGFLAAQLWLGCMYEKGEGVEPDRTQARFWYQKATDQGSSEAKTRLDTLVALERLEEAIKFTLAVSAQIREKTARFEALAQLEVLREPAEEAILNIRERRKCGIHSLHDLNALSAELHFTEAVEKLDVNEIASINHLRSAAELLIAADRAAQVPEGAGADVAEEISQVEALVSTRDVPDGELTVLKEKHATFDHGVVPDGSKGGELKVLVSPPIHENPSLVPGPIPPAYTPRVMKVMLRVAWRAFKSLVMIFLIAVGIYIVLMGAAAAWSTPQSRGGVVGAGESESEKFFSFMNSVTAPLQLVWSGFVTLLQILVLLLIFVGQATWAFLTTHESLAWIVGALGVGSYLVWTCIDEWRREFDMEYAWHKYETEDGFLQVDGGPHWIKGLLLIVGIAAVQIKVGSPVIWEFLVEAFHALRS